MDSTKPIAFTINPVRVVDAVDSGNYFDPTQHPNAVQRADECREIVDSGARALIYFSGPLDPEDERAVRTVLVQIRCAVLAERERWRAALFISPGSPVGTDEEIRMAVEPPEVVAGIIRDAKSAEQERCAKVADAEAETADKGEAYAEYGSEHRAVAKAEGKVARAIAATIRTGK